MSLEIITNLSAPRSSSASLYLSFDSLPHSGEMAVAAVNHVSHTVSERALARGDISPFSLPSVEYGISFLSILYQWRSIRLQGIYYRFNLIHYVTQIHVAILKLVLYYTE
jgi:hypothetical protein